jgi:hypothetical protein
MKNKLGGERNHPSLPSPAIIHFLPDQDIPLQLSFFSFRRRLGRDVGGRLLDLFGGTALTAL